MITRRLGSILVPCGLFALAAITAACKTSASEPSAGGDVVASPYDFSAFEQELFGGAASTEGAVVQVDGKGVYEKYAAGYDGAKRHLAYSVSKSVGSALLGIAVDQKLLALEDSICKWVPAPESADPAYCETTIGSLVQMTSGLKWDETYENPTVSNVLPMLYGNESDMGMYVAHRPRVATTGTRWSYSSGDSNLLARALRTALGGKDMRAWATEHLFAPAGLSSAIFESDRSGTLIFSSGVFMTPRDMARFGQLYLDEGLAGTTRVLPAAWVTFTKTPAPAVAVPTLHKSDALSERGGSYGASFWLNAATRDAPIETLLYPTAPRDTFCAQGQWGQRICMVPSRKLVIVRVGNDRQGFYNLGPAIGAAVTAIDNGSQK